MPCYGPIKGYRLPSGGLTFHRAKSTGQFLELPCGRCIGCKLAKAKEWTIRSIHEQQTYAENDLPSIFVTLTYDGYHLPSGGDLSRKHFPAFMKKLRKKFNHKIRFLMCGEYGEEKLRPHYHALLFGVDFPDRKFKCTRNGIPVFNSALLTKVWGRGRTEIGTVTSKSAGYVARYTIQKQEEDDRHLERINEQTGEIYRVQKPFNNSSNRHGLGYDWYQKYKSDVFPDDFVLDEKKNQQPTPGYYRVLLQRENPKLAEKLRKKRVEKAVNNPNNEADRLSVREACKIKQADRLIRTL